MLLAMRRHRSGRAGNAADRPMLAILAVVAFARRRRRARKWISILAEYCDFDTVFRKAASPSYGHCVQWKCYRYAVTYGHGVHILICSRWRLFSYSLQSSSATDRFQMVYLGHCIDHADYAYRATTGNEDAVSPIESSTAVRCESLGGTTVLTLGMLPFPLVARTVPSFLLHPTVRRWSHGRRPRYLPTTALEHRFLLWQNSKYLMLVGFYRRILLD